MTKWLAVPVWIVAGIVVVAAVLTAHGLYKVAVVSGVPVVLAYGYPVITDGLALVAYAATYRLARGEKAWAAIILFLAAGLSGLAQAVLLAEQLTAPWQLRFGVGYWPAVAAGLAAHLLYLLWRTRTAAAAVPVASGAVILEPAAVVVGVPPSDTPATATAAPSPAATPATPADVTDDTGDTPAGRAKAAAATYQRKHHTLPGAPTLAKLAGVSQSTAGNVLRELRKPRSVA